MIINCGYWRRVRKGSKYRTELRTVQNIEITDLSWKSDNHDKIRERLLAAVPANQGWRISGYALIKE